jgi:hypothetical protein
MGGVRFIVSQDYKSCEAGVPPHPVSEGFVIKPEDWKYSSESNYNSETSLIPAAWDL